MNKLGFPISIKISGILFLIKNFYEKYENKMLKYKMEIIPK